ncbi:MAG: hypothetical protein RR256_04200, partial [Bacteroidales bacterium]
EMSVDEKTQKFWDFMEFLFREYQEEDREEDNILHRMKQYWASLRVEGSEELFKKLKYVQTLQEYSYLCSSEKEKIIFRK